jgi:NhaP-type Na+/H+ or K+/H+ antiporter
LLGCWWDAAGSALLFGLLGARVDLASVEPRSAALAAALVAAALVPRAAAAYCCAGDLGLARWGAHGSGSGEGPAAARRQWTHDERLFAALCWCPKGTVQAALAALALDAAAARANGVPFDATEAADARRAEIVFTVRACANSSLWRPLVGCFETRVYLYLFFL